MPCAAGFLSGHRSATVRYATGLAIYLVALLLRVAIGPIEPSLPFVTFYPAALASFYFCGLGPGALVVALSAGSGYYLFSPPEWSWTRGWTTEILVLAYLGLSALTGWLIERGRSASRRLTAVNREQETMLDNELIGIVKLKGRTAIWQNRALQQMLGYGPGESLGQDTRLVYPDDDSYHRLGEEAYPILRSGGTYRTQLRLVRKDGQPIWVDMSGVMLSPERDESMWLLLDITELKRYQEQVEGLAFRDGLTGLPNRMLLFDRIRQAVPLCQRTHRELAVCFVDLDGFKVINDRLGHDAGDKLLQELATRLQACLRSNDTVARFGGDEFVLVLSQLQSREECEGILQRVIEVVQEPMVLASGQSARVSASVGVAICPDDGTDPELLLFRADAAMYAAKRAGRNQVAYFEELQTADVTDADA